MVSAEQNNVRYLIETLEPQSEDGFFAWNFFDGILMRKEYFSSYVFEDLAAEILAEDSDLKARLEEKKSNYRKALNIFYSHRLNSAWPHWEVKALLVL